jgi:hypothetical protein
MPIKAANIVTRFIFRLLAVGAPVDGKLARAGGLLLDDCHLHLGRNTMSLGQI